MKNHHSFILLLIFLAGCSSYSSLSSFSSRKYTKGYFIDAPAEKPTVASKDTKLDIRPKPEVYKNSQVVINTVVTKSLKPISFFEKKEKKAYQRNIPLSEFNTVHKIVVVNDTVNNNDKIRQRNKTTAWVAISIGIVLVLDALLLSHPIFIAAIILAAVLITLGLIVLLGRDKQTSMPKKNTPASKTMILIYKAAVVLGIILITIPLIINSGGIIYLIGLFLAIAAIICLIRAHQDNHTLEIMALISGIITLIFFDLLVNQGTTNNWVTDPLYGFGILTGLLFILAFLVGPGNKQSNAKK